MKESRGYSDLEGAALSLFASSAQGSLRKLRTDDLQQKPANGRESDSILIEALRARESLGARANSRVVIVTRSRRETVIFKHPFRIKGIDRQLPAGAYEVVTDEELIEGLSFPCFRRVATMIMVPGAPPHHSSIEMISISSVDLADAQQADAVASR